MAGKLSTGPNARPKDVSIASTAPGLPNDSSRPPQIDDAEVDRIAEKLRGPSPRSKLKEQLRQDTERPQKGSA